MSRHQDPCIKADNPLLWASPQQAEGVVGLDRRIFASLKMLGAILRWNLKFLTQSPVKSWGRQRQWYTPWKSRSKHQAFEPYSNWQTVTHWAGCTWKLNLWVLSSTMLREGTNLEDKHPNEYAEQETGMRKRNHGLKCKRWLACKDAL